ncbi:MAG TPA: hypothetical protein VHV08_00650 [Pirellulales bacterium]|jgi:hypothetical protein|nr:hypothetical protein [Pirellulales bacterium]
MNPGDLATGSAKLQKAWKKLCARWEETKLQWHDEVSLEFEQNYLTPLEPQIVSTLQRMRSLAAAASAAKNDCDQ